MRKVYCYVEKEEKPGEIDHSGDIVKDLSSLNISDIKNRSFFFIGGKIIENPYYEPSEYMKHVYEAIDAQYEQFYRSDKDKKDSEEEASEQSPNDEMPDWIAEMPYRELIKKFPGGISEALEYAKKEKGLSVPEVHYNSPEPKKLGVKAFTKNAEVYLAPGEGEETLKHELGHVVQQKKEKIPATTKIGEQQVNLDPKLEQEADKIAENLSNAKKSEEKTARTQNVIQFVPPTDDDFREIIKVEAAKLEFSPYVIMQEIIDKAREYYESWWSYSPLNLFRDYTKTCVIWALNDLKNTINQPENATEIQLYSELEHSKIQRPSSEQDERENTRISRIMDMLSTEKIFADSGIPTYTLHTIMQWLTPEQCQKVKKYILKLKTYCDAEGIKSVLEGASTNVNPARAMLYKPGGRQISDLNVKSLSESFVKRLELMTSYIEEVADKTYVDNGQTKKFGDEYWIRSTGSDPHYKGQHALFLVNKRTGNIEKVYKPHDLSADNAVVGREGIFSDLNRLLQKDFKSKLRKLGLAVEEDEELFATMDIDVEHHIEEFVKKERGMSQDNAKKYFFRAGMLKVITDAMAVIDLHQDNIMPVKIDTDNMAPLIIDAEVDFFEYALNSGLENRALVQDTFGGMLTGGITRPTNSTFRIIGTNIPSGQAFTLSDYQQFYKDGYNFLLEILQQKDKEKVFEDLYHDHLINIPDKAKIRILPFETPVFADYLQKGIQLPKSEACDYVEKTVRTKPKGTNRQEYASYVCDLIAEKLTSDDESISKPFIFRNEDAGLQANLDKNQLTKAIKSTFDNGTIIAMYCDINGNIYLDNIEVGNILIRNVHINKNQLVEVMCNAFKQKIQTIPYR